jgi:hypothetical protein
LISWQHLRGFDLLAAFDLGDLLGAALFRGLAKLGRNRTGVDQLLSETRSGECEKRDKT